MASSSHNSQKKMGDRGKRSGKERIPLVGIGASAGGLESFKALFSRMPADSGAAFVIVQHLDPNHESILTDLVGKFTAMKAIQVEDRTPVKPDCVYVIPPNRDMAYEDGTLILTEPAKPRGQRLPIDNFFRSLADHLGELALCLILSGSGTDGTLGLKAVKEKGGLTIVQSPDSAQYDGMPRSAINTGLVDMVLPPEEIGEALGDYITKTFAGKGGTALPAVPERESYLRKIFLMLQNQTAHDFSGYKENTIMRRIERRMAVNRINGIDKYLGFLGKNPGEVETLFRDLLIGVTRFFRDPRAFEALEDMVMGPLFSAPRDNPAVLRVWVPGCSTGEEAYSVAILLRERAEVSPRPFEIKVFATDIDQKAIARAREGRYPASIIADVAPERLKRFFTGDENDTYRVNKIIRDMVVFAEQSVIKDPPFSRLDLVCCRNLLIYLESDLQQRLFSLFHYALNREGYLFLGNSESLGESKKFFKPLNQKWKIYKKTELVADMKKVLEFSGNVRPRAPLSAARSRGDLSPRSITEKLLLDEYVPTSLLVNGKGDMLYIHGNTGKYLEQSTGDVSTNILRIAREGLRMPLSTALRSVSAQGEPKEVEGIRCPLDDRDIIVNLKIAPVEDGYAEDLFLVTFRERKGNPSEMERDESRKKEYTQTRQISELEQELRSTREYLQTVIEELETTNEELKSSNEELQSANEELQSTNEELQTSKEEIQSVNEELVTVNTELQARVEELTLANDDIKNLMESTQMGIIFLDNKLCIRRYTEASRRMVDLIPGDIGRPLKNFVHKLQTRYLIKEARSVLDSLETRSMEVQDENYNWYILQIMPYLTVNDRADGVVLTLTDVTELKRSEARLTAAVTAGGVGIYHHVFSRASELYVNDQYASMLGYAREDIPSEYEDFLKWYNDAVHPDDLPMMRKAYEDFIGGKSPEYELELRMRHRDGRWINVMGYGRALERNDEGRLIENIGVTLDVTKYRMVLDRLRLSTDKYNALFHNLPLAGSLYKIIRDGNGNIVDWQFYEVNQLCADIVGGSREELIGKSALERFGPMVMEHYLEKSREVVETGVPKQFEVQSSRNGRYYLVSLFLVPEDNLAMVSLDITKRKKTEEELLRSGKLESLGVLAGGIAHDFNNLMMAVSGQIELALSNMKRKDPARKHLELANQARERASRLTGQLLTFAKGGYPLKEAVNIEELLRDSVLFSMHGSKSKLDMKIDTDLWIAEVDQGQFSQAINNLILNARQAMPDGGTIKVRAKNREREGKFWIEVRISDEGVGIATENLSRIFDPYFSTKPDNHGLGLPMVHSIVTRHRGKISLESKEGEGTVFTLHFPANPQGKIAQAPESKDRISPVESSRPLCVLLLDDEKAVRESIRDELIQLGHTVVTFSRGEKALAAYRSSRENKTPFDVLILDLTIPGGMSGLEVAREVQKTDSETAMIVISGYANDQVMAQYEDFGFTARLVKPFSLGALRETLNGIL